MLDGGAQAGTGRAFRRDFNLRVKVWQANGAREVATVESRTRPETRSDSTYCRCSARQNDTSLSLDVTWPLVALTR